MRACTSFALAFGIVFGLATASGCAPTSLLGAEPSAEGAESSGAPGAVAELQPDDSEKATASPALSGVKPSVQTMLELSQSRPAWDRMIDPTRGVVVVDFFDDASGEDPRADAEGRVQLGQLLCGPELAAELDRMHKELEWRVGERDPEYGPTFWCNRYNCSHGAEMEFDHNGGYNFVAGPNGPVLDHVVRIEGGPVIEEFSVEGSAFARGEIARLANARCG